MKELPNAFWACIFLMIAVALAMVALLASKEKDITMAVLTLASSIATGAFGYIQGHKDGAASAVAANPTQAALPPQQNP